MTKNDEYFVDFKQNFNPEIFYETKVVLQTPSVTMPRIKTITSGDISTFIDIILNLNSSEITEDNIVDILIKYKKFNINLYGDETWLKLFPNRFQVSDCTSSFFVKDYYEVDQNVTRNIPQILANLSQWDMVIMHYLGLDHIGHVEGPFSKRVKPKLIEMKNVVKWIIEGLSNSSYWNSTLVIVTGDHGMSDLGGHGGATVNELTTSIMFFNQKLHRLESLDDKSPIFQSDISTSISLLTGVPIPINSVGVISFRLLSMIDELQDRSNALYSNFHHFINNDCDQFQEFVLPYKNIRAKLDQLNRICQTPIGNETCVTEINEQHLGLIKLLKEMQKVKMSKSSSFNTLYMEIGMGLLSFSLIHSVLHIFQFSNARTLHLYNIGRFFIVILVMSILFPENFCEFPIYFFIKFSIFIIGFFVFLILCRKSKALNATSCNASLSVSLVLLFCNTGVFHK